MMMHIPLLLANHDTGKHRGVRLELLDDPIPAEEVDSSSLDVDMHGDQLQRHTDPSVSADPSFVTPPHVRARGPPLGDPSTSPNPADPFPAMANVLDIPLKAASSPLVVSPVLAHAPPAPGVTTRLQRGIHNPK
jgi:hypothetical protein